MTERKQGEQFRHAVDARLSGLEGDPRLAEHILANAKGEVKVKMKFSIALVLLMVALMLIGIGIAANVNIFDVFARFEGDGYLARLNEAAQPYENQVVEIPADGPYPAAKFILNQAYYDGQSLIIAYTLSEQWIPLQFMNPQDALTEHNDLVSERYLDMPKSFFDYVISPQDIALMDEKLAVEGSMFAQGWSQSIHDSYVMAGDVRIDASRVNLSHLPDGTTIGYIEFAYPLPEQIQNQDELSIAFFFSRGAAQYYEDETGFYIKGIPNDAVNVNLPVTIKRNAHNSKTLYGYEHFGDYHVTAMAAVSDVEIKIHITISASAEIIQELAERYSLLGYHLYVGDEKYTSTNQVSYPNTDNITIDLLFEPPENPTDKDFRLVPCNNLPKPQIDDVIPLHKSR